MHGDAEPLETAWPGHIVVLDPYAGEVHGHRQLRHFFQTSRSFLAERLVDVERVASTHVGSRAVVELLAHLQLDGGPVTWPVAVVVQSVNDRSVTFRTYGSQWPVVGRRPIRAAILDPDPDAEPGDVVARYLTALAAGDRDGVVQTFTTDGYLREPIGSGALHRGTDELAEYFSRSSTPVAASTSSAAASPTTVCAARWSTTACGGAGVRCPRKRVSPCSSVTQVGCSRRLAVTTTSKPRSVGDRFRRSVDERTPDRRLRAAVGSTRRRARQPSTARSTGCATRASTARRSSDESSGDSPGTGRCGVADAQRGHRRYVDRTMVLETTYVTPTGPRSSSTRLAMGEGNRGHALGRDAPHLLLRQIRCDRRRSRPVDVDYVPRPEYGLVAPLFDAVDGGVRATGGADSLMLSCPDHMTVESSSASVQLSLREGEQAGFALHHRKQADGGSGADLDRKTRSRARLTDTIAAWQSWSELHQAYVGPWHDLVHHSGRVLQALSFQPTGAICAAPTTSLPESVGGTRNWDYRYAWVRDASLTIEALWVAACPDEANEFFDYITASAAGSLDDDGDLQIMFGIGGERDLTERELPHLPGWRGVLAGAGRERRVASAPDRRLRRAPQRGASALGPDLRPRRPGRTAGRRRKVGRRPSSHRALGTSWSRSPTPRRRAGGRRTRGSGRCVANRSTSSTRSSCAGSRSTGRSTSPTASAPRTGSRIGRRPGTRSGTRS